MHPKPAGHPIGCPTADLHGAGARGPCSKSPVRCKSGIAYRHSRSANKTNPLKELTTFPPFHCFAYSHDSLPFLSIFTPELTSQLACLTSPAASSYFVTSGHPLNRIELPSCPETEKTTKFDIDMGCQC